MDQLRDWNFQSKGMDMEDDFYFDYGVEEITDYQDPAELVAALKQKEEEVILAAQLGKALLLENRQLKEQSDKLHEQYADKLEELEQGRHELQLKLEGCQSQWESQVGDLERDVRDLSAQVERLNQALSEAKKDKSRAELEHSEQTHRLKGELNAAMEVKKTMSAELQALKQELQQKGSHDRQHDKELISAMKEQVLLLTQKEELLGQRLESAYQENAELRASLASLHSRLAQHEQLDQQHNQQLAEAWQEVDVARSRSQQLQAQVEELQEEASLQESRSLGDASLLSELETADYGVSKEEMTKEMQSILQLLAPLTRGLSSPERSEVEHEQEDLVSMLHRLKGVAETVATQASSPQELNLGFVSSMVDHCGNPSTTQELRDQNIQLQQENAEIKQKLQNIQDQSDMVQQAIRDRDEAIAKKNMMETELVRSKNDMMSLNNQLLEAIQRKLELSQELEAWQDDIQIVINQQLKSQQQLEQPQKKLPSNGMSFFRRPSKVASTWTRQPSSSWISDSNQDKAQAPWKDWLRRGKGSQYGK
ncbi:Bicaudal D-related protein 1 [Oryzias melastigma]|uniref:Bicaudal D-related protein 1 n=1 Tax=Oryzias melastigma TaxID=30732 RepID=A0A3B3C9K7_ORYME|nr:BICD family-like cargo adapter 1 [Oryzias melastigma]XP_036070892.1 BICD family-like cargo adapter 1 [Oryzias melastigma]KAF6736015.1 Bicaudal D-related protein 1 [Oryzias melastigma]